jgi:threonine dehydratase
MRRPDLFSGTERTAPSASSPRAAAERIGGYVRRTPLLRVTTDGRPIAFKLEFLQMTGSFKVRGALNALLSRREVLSSQGGSGRLGHVVTASGGNHGLGVAAAARWLGISATVYVPRPVPEVKARRIMAAGAEIVRFGDSYAEAEMEARHLATRDGLYYVHAYDAPAVVEGQGTVGLEILADMPECDVIAVPVGGGGLLAGTVLAAQGLATAELSAAMSETGSSSPNMYDHGDISGDMRTVVGVEPQGCPTLHAAVSAGHPVDMPPDGTSVAASALGATRAGRLAFAACQTGGVGLALVSDEQILAARGRLWEEFRLAVEPAAATVFAAWLSGQVPGDFPCLVLSGANADWTP